MKFAHVEKWAVGLAALLIGGCGRGDEAISLVPVAGVVLSDGRPVDGAQVQFHPIGGGPRSTISLDVTGPEGSFRATYRGEPGLAAGQYKVTVRKVAAKPGSQAGLDPEMARMAGLVVDLLPGEYAAPETSPLTVTLDDSGASDLVLEVKEKSSSTVRLTSQGSGTPSRK